MSQCTNTRKSRQSIQIDIRCQNVGLTTNLNHRYSRTKPNFGSCSFPLSLPWGSEFNDYHNLSTYVKFINTLVYGTSGVNLSRVQPELVCTLNKCTGLIMHTGKLCYSKQSYEVTNTAAKPNMHARLKTMQRQTSPKSKRTSGRRQDSKNFFKNLKVGYRRTGRKLGKGEVKQQQYLF